MILNASGCLDALTAPEVAQSLDAFVTKTVTPLPREGNQPVQELLDAMRTLLRLYDKTSDNEARTVLGMLETEIPYLDPKRDRLLRALARAQQQDKRKEYQLVGLRYTLARKNLDAIEQQHRALVAQLPPQP